MATLACLALTATGLSACQNDITLPNSDVDYCTIIADPPVKNGSHIDGPGRYRCDGKGADTITITVKLEKMSSGSWVTLNSGTFVAHGADTSRSKSEGSRTRHVSAGCSTGQFRSVIHAVEKSHGHTQDYDSHSVTVPNPCKTSF